MFEIIVKSVHLEALLQLFPLDHQHFSVVFNLEQYYYAAAPVNAVTYLSQVDPSLHALLSESYLQLFWLVES